MLNSVYLKKGHFPESKPYKTQINIDSRFYQQPAENVDVEYIWD